MRRLPSSPKEAAAVVAGVSLWVFVDAPRRWLERHVPHLLAWLRGGAR